MRPIRFVAALEWKVKVSVGADVLGGPQPQSNEIALWGGCGRPRTSAPTGGIEGLWGKDIGSFFRKAQMHFCSDAQMPRSVKTARAVLTDRVLCHNPGSFWYNTLDDLRLL